MGNAELKGSVNSEFHISNFALSVKDTGLFSGFWWDKSKVTVGCGRGDAAARRTSEKALLHQERLVDLLERPRILTDRRGDRLHADGSALEHLDDRLEDAGVHVVEPELVYVEPLQRFAGHGRGDFAAGTHLRVIAHAFEEPVRHTRRAPAAARDLRDARRVGCDAENAGRAGDDLDEIIGRIVVEAFDQSEARAQRRGQQTKPRRGADQREALQLHRQRLGVRAVGNAHVDPEFLHRRVQELFQRRPQAVHFIYKEDVARLERGDHPYDIAGPPERGPGGGADVDDKFFGLQQRERRLAEAGRAENSV